MMQVVTISLVLIGALPTLPGCKKNYAPPATSADYGYPVVESVVNAGFVPYIPIDAIRVPPIFGPVIEFTVTSIPGCVDCMTRGGINRPPSFWQN